MEEFIYQIFNQRPTNIKKIETGLTNDNYYFEINNEKYVIRIPKNQHADYQLEEEILRKVDDFNVEIIYYNEGYLISKYIEDAQTFNQNPDIIAVAKLMKQFHHSGLHASKKFDLVKTFNKYYQSVSHSIYNVKPYLYLVDEIQKINNPTCLCHNDWVSGNILFSKEKVYLIDYEYAGENDPLFDVMSFLSENKIYDPMLRQLFYLTYFDKIDQKILQQLNIYEQFENLLWYFWALMMFEKDHNNIYLEIAKEKFQRLEKGTSNN